MKTIRKIAGVQKITRFSREGEAGSLKTVEGALGATTYSRTSESMELSSQLDNEEGGIATPKSSSLKNLGDLIQISRYNVLGIPRDTSNLSTISHQLQSLGRMCTNGHLNWSLRPTTSQRTLGYTNDIRPVAMIPEYAQNLNPTFKMPPSIVRRGTWEGDLGEYISIFGFAQQSWIKALDLAERAGSIDPNLLELERSQVKKQGLVAHGVKGASVYELADRIQTNMSDKKFLPIIEKHYANMLEKYGLSPKGLDYSKPVSLPRQKGQGLAFSGKAVLLERNSVATILNAKLGTYLLKKKVDIKTLESLWGMTGIPSFSGLMGTRNSARKINEIVVYGPQGCHSALEGSGMICDSRTIVNPCKFLSAATTQAWSQVLDAMNKMPWRGIDKDLFAAEVKSFRSLSSGKYYEASVDKTRFDATCKGSLMEDTIAAFPFTSHEIDLINYASSRAVLGPKRSSSSKGTVFDIGLKRLGSGEKGTTPRGHGTNDKIFFQFCYEYFRETVPGDKRGSLYLWYAFGDDGYFVSRDPDAIEALIDYIASFGLVGSEDPGCIYLMNFFPPQGGYHGLGARRLQNFFEPETFKREAIINNIVVAAHEESMVGHPLYQAWHDIISLVVQKYPFCSFKTIKECSNYARSDQAKRDIADYAKTSVEAARQVEDLFSGSMQSLIAAGYDDSDDESVLGLLGLANILPDIQVYDDNASSRHISKLLDIFEIWNRETWSGQELGALSMGRDWLGMKKNESILTAIKSS